MSSTRSNLSPRPAALLRTASDAPLGICHVDENGDLAWANPAMARLLGFSSPADLVAIKTAWSLFHEQSPVDSLEALSAGRDHFTNEDALLASADGSPVEVRLDGSMLKSRGGATWLLYARAIGT
ncbi:MAG: PAS domain-containing protein, partial [Acidobacteria bacterium]|nr:PAS domain-containing protein [Acidobacteriota bacterium]